MATKKTFTDPDAKRLALAKLATSGLTEDDFDRLGMAAVPAWRVAEMGFAALPALLIPYYGPDGKPMKDWPGVKEPFYRIRYLAEPVDLKAQTDSKKTKYMQKPGTSACAYFPQTYGDWARALSDPDESLVITEGELKAAAFVSVMGRPCIGIGGVYNWRSLPKGVPLLPELEAINWVRRNVYIAYDSDFATNPMVCAALREFGEELISRGAFVHIATLPVVAGLAKTGLDDFLMANGKQGMAEVLHMADPLGLTAPLFALNEKWVYIEDPGLVLRRVGHSKVAPSAFKEHVEATKAYYEGTLKPDGIISRKAVSAAAAWISWPLRGSSPRMTYSPGQPEQLDNGEWNIWPGWGVEPKKGDVKPFYKLFDHLMTGAEPHFKQWFLRWMAYPLAFPGTKLFSAVVLHGRRTGTGKSLLGYTLGRIYGKNFIEINQTDLHAGFNAWAEGKQLVLADDITGSNKRAEADVLKKLITQKDMQVNIKYVPSFVVPDRINYLFTSNHADVFFLEDDDRRYGIHEVEVGPLDQAFYQSYMKWLDSGGSAAVFDHLTRLDFGDFDPAARPPVTGARERMIADIQSDLGGWVRDLLADPERMLALGATPSTRDLWTTRQLLALYDPMEKTGTTANGLGRELKRAGIRQVNGGMPLRGPDGAQARYYAVRNADKWLKASAEACSKHILEADEVTGKPKAKY